MVTIFSSLTHKIKYPLSLLATAVVLTALVLSPVLNMKPVAAQTADEAALTSEQIIEEYDQLRELVEALELQQSGGGLLGGLLKKLPIAGPLLDELLSPFLNHGEKNSLLAKLSSSQKHFEKGKLCQAIQHLDLFLDEIERLYEKHPDHEGELDTLRNASWNLRVFLIEDPRAADCKEIPGAGMTEPAVQIGESSNTELSFSVELPAVQLTTLTQDDQTFTQVHREGIDGVVGEPGEPAVPMWRTMIGVPQDAAARIVSVNAEVGGQIPMLLLPFQEQPVDQEVPEDEVTPEPDSETFADQPFVINRDAYAENIPHPDNPTCEVTMIGNVRDLAVAQVECPTGHFNPAEQSFQYYNGFNVEIAFEGGDGNFITSRSSGPFEPATAQYQSAVLNNAVLGEYKLEIVPPGFCSGEELLVLTHPDFREAADRLVDHKRDKGIMTNVFNVNDGAGSGPDSNSEIDDFIEERYDDCNVRPSYVLLLGDAEYIPPFYLETTGSDTTGTDYPYAIYPQGFFDILPDFGVGRLPVDTLAQADVVVDKIINYEKNPPTFGAQANTFYNSATIASQFQCCRGGSVADGTTQRTFTEVSEFARNVLVGAGKSVDRIYHQTVDSDYTGDDTPRYYYDGDPLPYVLGPNGSYNWDVPESTRTEDIVDSWNDGRFLVIHRDHGWEHGWGNPYFDSNNVSNDLDNGEYLPVVFSVNCASGLFDNETAGGDYGTNANSTYFAERLLREEDGGAIGVLGDTRNSPSWPNTALTMGFMDATWPNARGDFGDNTSKHRLADILNHGKFFMITQIPVPAAMTSAESAVSELIMWHVIGDPTLEMRTKSPFNIGTFYEAEFNPGFVNIYYEEPGAELTVFQINSNNELLPIARGMVEDGVAELPYFETPTDGDPIMISACVEDGVCELLTPEVTPTEGGELLGMKYEDRDGDGERDDGEPGLEAWEINLLDVSGDLVATTSTAADGRYRFADVAPGSYRVEETQQDGWSQTQPTRDIGGYDVDVKEESVIEGLDFGNQQVIE